MSLKCYLFNLLTTILIIPFMLISCKDTQGDSTIDIIFPESDISYSKHVGPLFQQRCAVALCHGGTEPSSGLNLEYPSYQALLSRPGLVVQHDGAHSTLIQHLEGILSPMPPAGFPQLTRNQINGVKKWIDEGALNN